MCCGYCDNALIGVHVSVFLMYVRADRCLKEW